MAEPFDDGGVAFVAFPGNGDDWAEMSLRDWFAGLAMQAAFTGETAQLVVARNLRDEAMCWSDAIASNAYEMADAMIERRKRK